VPQKKFGVEQNFAKTFASQDSQTHKELENLFFFESIDYTKQNLQAVIQDAVEIKYCYDFFVKIVFVLVANSNRYWDKTILWWILQLMVVNSSFPIVTVQIKILAVTTA